MTQLDRWLANTKPLIPVIVIDDLAHAIPMAKALVAGGVHLLEVTLRTEAGLAAIRAIRENVPEAIVGAGTVCTADDFQKAIDAGAQFIVSPGLTPELIEKAKRIRLDGQWQGVFLPGVATASEVMVAAQAGMTQLKCFPASAIGGAKLLKAWSGPFPDIQFCPTGGISKDNYQEYLGISNVICAGGSWLTESKLLIEGDWNEVTRRASEIVNLSDI
ncbi:MAG: 2-dehydro-3-deoxyphosphogluconate aldolase/(4S)-4-hydroxy-2-oxoglutarate aldolase [Oleispira sp.]|jgi:2-dehydro-3-deoxyphosphogluconate aldolase/(4S)-4-hydroxy-2-oxoglutarate aldolase